MRAWEEKIWETKTTSSGGLKLNPKRHTHNILSAHPKSWGMLQFALRERNCRRNSVGNIWCLWVYPVQPSPNAQMCQVKHALRFRTDSSKWAQQVFGFCCATFQVSKCQFRVSTSYLVRNLSMHGAGVFSDVMLDTGIVTRQLNISQYTVSSWPFSPAKSNEGRLP